MMAMRMTGRQTHTTIAAISPPFSGTVEQNYFIHMYMYLNVYMYIHVQEYTSVHILTRPSSPLTGSVAGGFIVREERSILKKKIKRKEMKYTRILRLYWIYILQWLHACTCTCTCSVIHSFNDSTCTIDVVIALRGGDGTVGTTPLASSHLVGSLNSYIGGSPFTCMPALTRTYMYIYNTCIMQSMFNYYSGYQVTCTGIVYMHNIHVHVHVHVASL